MRIALSLRGRRATFLGIAAAAIFVFLASAASADMERVSVDSAGMEADAGSAVSSLSGDGQVAVFASSARNLVPDDTNFASDVFVRDRTAGTTVRVSVDSAGDQAVGSSINPTISQDGGTVAFVSSASDLVAGDTNGRLDVFVHDRATGTTERVSVASDGTQASSDSFAPSLSHDGSRVAFASLAANLVPDDTNGTFDVFVHDRATGTTVRVSVASDGTQADGSSLAPRLSADGLTVVFHSQATNLVAGDGNGMSDVFVHDLATGTTSRVSVGALGEEGNFASTAGTLSADGRFVAFNSDATNLVPGDTNAVTDVFVHDRVTATTERVSVASDGTQADRVSGFVDPPSLSADGSRVAFLSAAMNLAPGDVNALVDVFVHDRTTGTTTLASVAADGTPADGPSVLWATLSSDGRAVVFTSLASNLVPDDNNFAQDVFVATMDSCGDGAVQSGEECDDGGNEDGDCCSALCTFEAAGAACSDGDLCTLGDVCDGAGACAGEPVVCDASPACHEPASCDPATGACVAAPLPDGSVCDDGDACTAGDVCTGGACAPGELDPEACADPVQCYRATPAWGSSTPRRKMMLSDPFAEGRYHVKHAEGLCTAVKVKIEGAAKGPAPGVVTPSDAKAMHACHHIHLVETKPPQPRFERRLVRVASRVGDQVLELKRPDALCLAAGDKKAPADGVAYTCYEARLVRVESHSALGSAAHSKKHKEKARKPHGIAVKLYDRYRTWSTSLLQPDAVCAPTRVDGSGEVRPEVGLACFEVRDKPNHGWDRFHPRRQKVASLLGTAHLDVWRPERVCVPAVLEEVADTDG